MAKTLILFYVMVFFFTFFILMANCETDDGVMQIPCKKDSDCPPFWYCFRQVCYRNLVLQQ
ncbi:unnamed protein product [Lupinus luteus]|uniref:Late nodulin domain-containing protein n=1 Tax=Lupinus luteus TaxID=3873 RepID=A0AAV1X332_LUPLU